VKDWKTLPQDKQIDYTSDYIEKMTGDIGTTNPAMEQAIRDYFGKDAPGKSHPEGVMDLYVELALLDDAAKTGRADLSKIQVEGVIVAVVKRKFLPQEARK